MAERTDLSKAVAGGSEEMLDVCCSLCSDDGRSRQAEKYCIECQMFYCGKCLKHHSVIPSSRGHQIVDKSQPEDGSTRTALPTERCVRHHGKLKDMYCSDHEVVCCVACFAVEHRTCVRVYLTDIARGIKESQEFKDVKGMLHTVHCELQREQTKRKDNLSSLENESEHILSEINQHEDDLINKIRDLLQATKGKFNYKLSEGTNILEENIKNITSEMTTLSLIENHISRGKETEIFAKVKHGKIAVKDCRVLLKDLSERLNRKMLCFVANHKLLAEVNESECMGIVNVVEEEEKEDKLKIKVEEQKTGSFHIGVKEGVTEEKLNIEFREEKKRDPELQQYTAKFSEKYRVNESYCQVTAACVLDNKSLLLFDNTTHVLKRLSMDDFKIFDQLELQVDSYSICSVGTQEVAVALCYDKKIQLVSVGSTMTLTRSFSTEQYCPVVAFNEVSGEFYVSNNINQVNVYDKNGMLMRTYDKDGEGMPLFSMLSNMAWSEDKAALYVTDWNKGLLALSVSGNLLWTYSNSKLKLANSLCVLPDEVILVSGVDSNNVIQVGKHGKKIKTLFDAGDTLCQPWALAYDRNTSRLIVGQQTNEILVYNLNK